MDLKTNIPLIFCKRYCEVRGYEGVSLYIVLIEMLHDLKGIVIYDSVRIKIIKFKYSLKSWGLVNVEGL